jgi:uncharacterized membrane protein
MKQIKQFIKTAILGGFLVIIPCAILLIVGQWIVEILLAWVQGLTRLLLNGSMIHSVAANAIVIGILIISCFLVGVFVRTSLGILVFGLIEKGILNRIPGYKLVKETVSHFIVNRKTPFSTVVLLRISEGSTWMTGFVTDTHENGYLTVFVPTAPSPTSGFIYHVSPDNVQYLTADTQDAIRSIISCGAGTSAFFPVNRPASLASLRGKDPHA